MYNVYLVLPQFWHAKYSTCTYDVSNFLGILNFASLVYISVKGAVLFSYMTSITLCYVMLNCNVSEGVGYIILHGNYIITQCSLGRSTVYIFHRSFIFYPSILFPNSLSFPNLACHFSISVPVPCTCVMNPSLFFVHGFCYFLAGVHAQQFVQKKFLPITYLRLFIYSVHDHVHVLIFYSHVFFKFY